MTETLEKRVNISKIRGGHKSRVTTLLNDLSNALTESETSKAWVQDQLIELKRQQSIILELDSQILPVTDKVDEEILKASEHNLKITNGIRQANEFLNKLSQHTENIKSVKLPNISLKKFNGSPLEWPSFWDLFKSSIHNRTDIAEPTKFYYLLSQLEGDAAFLLSDFDHTTENYTEAIQLLKQTYGKTKLLIQARLHAIFDMESPSPNAVDLGRFRSQYEAHIRGLKSLGANIADAGYIYAAIILRKLPTRITDNINRASASDSWSLDELRAAIEREIDLLRSSEEVMDVRKSHGAAPYQGEFVSTMSYASNHSNNHNRNKSNSVVPRVPKCSFCDGNHSYFKCTEFSNTQSRKERAIKLGLCFNCLRNNHSVKNCRVNMNCRICDKKHHTILCSKSSNNFDNISSNHVALGVPQNYSDSNETSAMTISETKSSKNDDQNNSFILPTANMTLLGNETGNSVTRCLFNTGAQRTYILKSLVNKLRLQPFKYNSLSIEGFNTIKQSCDYPVVSLTAETDAERIKFEANVVENLPSRISMPGRD